MPFFTSLRLLRVENQMQEGPMRSDVRVPEPPSPADGGTTQAAAASANEIKSPSPAAVDSVPVIGRERLKVRMEIDLLKFLDAAKGIAAQSPVPGR
jgi:hypothetical protein